MWLLELDLRESTPAKLHADAYRVRVRPRTTYADLAATIVEVATKVEVTPNFEDLKGPLAEPFRLQNS